MSNTRHQVVGALVGGSIGAALFALERFVLRRNAGGFLRGLPFLHYLGLRSLLYASVILLIDAVAADSLTSGHVQAVGQSEISGS
jgi:hypothetical protein